MRLIAVAVLAVCLASFPTAAKAAGPERASDKNSDDLNSGLVYGEGHAFWLTAPSGWVLDNSSGVGQGLYAVFYPAGSSWSGSPVVMYANTVERDTANDESLSSFIDGDIDEAREHSPHLRVEREPPLLTAAGTRAEVRVFSGDQWGNSERVAYILERRVFVILTLTSKQPGPYALSLRAFESLVKSFKFLTEDVVVTK
jgi:hypothetical protein